MLNTIPQKTLLADDVYAIDATWVVSSWISYTKPLAIAPASIPTFAVAASVPEGNETPIPG